MHQGNQITTKLLMMLPLLYRGGFEASRQESWPEEKGMKRNMKTWKIKHKYKMRKYFKLSSCKHLQEHVRRESNSSKLVNIAKQFRASLQIKIPTKMGCGEGLQLKGASVKQGICVWYRRNWNTFLFVLKTHLFGLTTMATKGRFFFQTHHQRQFFNPSCSDFFLLLVE